MSEDEPICPCEAVPHPRLPYNRPGLDRIDYRIGDFSSFRNALLLPLPNEQALTDFRPEPRGDLAVQLLEWWAYLADVLVFYNERLANSAYLRTAELPEHITRLVRTLGFRPRPGVGATGVLGLLVNSKLPLLLPAGIAVQSKPTNGQPPQVFEASAGLSATSPGELAVDPLSSVGLSGSSSVLVQGAVTGVAVNDLLLVVSKAWSGSGSDYCVRSVLSVALEKDPRGAKQTRIVLQSPLSLPSGGPATDYRLLKAEQVTPLYAFPANGVVGSSSLHLAGITRSLTPGSMALVSFSSSHRLVNISSYQELIWFANASAGTPATPPAAPAIPQAVPHSVVSFTPSLGSSPTASSVLVRYALRELGALLREPPREVSSASLTLLPRGPVPSVLLPGKTVLLEDATERGAMATVLSAGPTQISVTLSAATPLTMPLKLLYNVLPISRGASVPREILGSGDAGASSQSFRLKKSPLTYLPVSAGGALGSVGSTLIVYVDGVRWTEVQSFFGQGPTARVFVTREDDDWHTSVIFGDGLRGARLPTGKDNVVASYRYGSGATAPAAGTLSTLLKPISGLRAVRNPVAVGAGADPDPSINARIYAPRSVLTFGRAISADDYETIAAQAPGVARARADYTWDGSLQRAGVTVYVGDDSAALLAARNALRGAADPNLPINVLPAQPRHAGLWFTLIVEPDYEPDAVELEVQNALLEPQVGLFSNAASRIGGAIYRSQIYEACQRVAGVRAVRQLSLTGSGISAGPRFSPGNDGFILLAETDLHISRQEAGDGD